jgi:hypothetical protein
MLTTAVSKNSSLHHNDKEVNFFNDDRVYRRCGLALYERVISAQEGPAIHVCDDKFTNKHWHDNQGFTGHRQHATVAQQHQCSASCQTSIPIISTEAGCDSPRPRGPVCLTRSLKAKCSDRNRRFSQHKAIMDPWYSPYHVELINTPFLCKIPSGFFDSFGSFLFSESQCSLQSLDATHFPIWQGFLDVSNVARKANEGLEEYLMGFTQQDINFTS